MSTPAVPAAPAAPAPTPAPATAPAAPASPPASSTAPSGNEFDSEFDKLDKRAAPKPPEPAKAPEPKPGEPKPGEPKSEPAAAPVAKDTPKDGPKALREALEKRNKEYGDLESKHRELEKKITETETKGNDSAALTERLATLEKQMQEKDAENRALKQEASPEFKDKYDKPFNQAASNAKIEIEQLQVGVTGPDGQVTMRPANWQKDFGALFALDYASAKQMAKSLFGEEAGLVMDHYNSLKRMDRERAFAFEEERKGWKEREEKQQAEHAKQREYIEATWTKVNADIVGKSEWFQPNPEDAEESKLLEDGYKLVDSKPSTIQEKIVQDANIRNRAASHARLKYVIGKRDARIAELEATIAELKGSEPGGVQRPGGHAPPPTEKDWKSDLRETGAISGD